MKRTDSKSHVILHKVKKQWVSILSATAALVAIVGIGAQPVAVHAETVDDQTVQTEDANAVALKKAKIKATTELVALKNISNNEKAQLSKEIIKSTTLDDVKVITESATKLDGQYLTEFKKNAKEVVNSLKGLTSEQKTEAITNIDAKTSTADVDTLVKSSLDSIDKSLEMLNSVKDVSKSGINAMNNLTADEKAALTKAIDEAKDLKGVGNVLSKAIGKDTTTRVELNSTKEDAKTIINNLKDIKDENRKKALKAVDDAKTIKEVAAAVRDAIGQDVSDKQLTEFQNNARDVVNSLIGLTKGQKKQAVENIYKATSTAAVNKIVNNALDNNADLDTFKKNAKEVIESLAGLSKEEARDLVREMNSAKTVEAANEVVQKALDQAQANLDLDTFKKNAKELINSLDGLSATQKETFVQKVLDAKNSKEVNTIVNDALDKAGEGVDLQTFKDNAIEVVNSLVGISPTDKPQIINEIKRAKTTGEVNKIVNDALDKSVDVERLRADAYDKIDALEGLSKAEKQDYKKRVDNAYSKDEIDQVVSDAKARSKQNLKKEAKPTTPVNKEENNTTNKQNKAQKDGRDTPQTGEKNTVAYALTGIALLSVAVGTAVIMKKKANA